MTVDTVYTYPSGFTEPSQRLLYTGSQDTMDYLLGLRTSVPGLFDAQFSNNALKSSICDNTPVLILLALWMNQSNSDLKTWLSRSGVSNQFVEAPVEIQKAQQLFISHLNPEGKVEFPPTKLYADIIYKNGIGHEKTRTGVAFSQKGSFVVQEGTIEGVNFPFIDRVLNNRGLDPTIISNYLPGAIRNLRDISPVLSVDVDTLIRNFFSKITKIRSNGHTRVIDPLLDELLAQFPGIDLGSLAYTQTIPKAINEDSFDRLINKL
jgi:hypothetical protein